MSDTGNDATSPEKKRPEEESRFRWLQVAPIYCDSYTAQLMPDGSTVRIVFGEYVGRGYERIYRAAVAMPLEDIKALRKTLARIIKEAEGGSED